MTNTAISRVLGSKPRNMRDLERKYQTFCQVHKINPASKRRRYWLLARSQTLDHVKRVFDARLSRSLRDPKARKARLQNAGNRIPGQITVSVVAFDRNPDVVAEVLERAQGKCEACKQNAPFVRRSGRTPYLEVHHKNPLAKGGRDTVANAIALCPNCHRKAHYG